MPLVVALVRRSLRQLAPALEVGVVELVLRRLLGHGGPRGSRRGARRTASRISSSDSASISASRSLASSTSGWIRLSSRSFESTKRVRKPSMGRQYRRGAVRARVSARQLRSARSRCRSRARGATNVSAARPTQNRTDIERRRRVHLRVLQRRQARRLRSAEPQRGERSCWRQSPSGSAVGSRPPLPSGRWSWRLIGRPSSAVAAERPSASRPPAAVGGRRSRRRARRGCRASARRRPPTGASPG